MQWIWNFELTPNNRLWVATYGKGIKQMDLRNKTLNEFLYQTEPKSIHYNDILSISKIYTGTLWFGSDMAQDELYDAYLEKFNFYHNQEVPENINIDVIRSNMSNENEKSWLGTSRQKDCDLVTILKLKLGKPLSMTKRWKSLESNRGDEFSKGIKTKSFGLATKMKAWSIFLILTPRAVSAF